MLQVVTAATNLPISIAECKSWLRITEQDEETDVLAVLQAAIDAVRRMTSGGIVLAPTTFDLTLDELPGGTDKLYLPSVPLTSITSFAYYDTSNDAQTLTENTDYTLFAPTDGQGWLRPVINTVWPGLANRGDAVTIRFVAGYATDATVPPVAKQAIRMLAGHFWENREAEVTGTISTELKLSVRSLLDSLYWGFVP